jgi:hypothetical protein
MAKPATQVQNNGKPQVAPQAVPQTAGSVIPHINPKAMQKDLGPRVIRMFAGIDEAKSEVERLRREIGQKNYDAIALLTEGVFKVAIADNNVALADHFSEDEKRKQVLNEQLYLALGMKEVIPVGTGDSKVNKVVWAKANADFLPQYGEPTDTPEYERKNTFRTNLSKQLNKAIGAALDIQKRKITAKYDEEKRTLVISGPEVKKQFGVESVALNERIHQGVPGTDGNPTKLLEKPSFTSLYNSAAKAEGKVIRTGSNDRTKKVITDPSAAIVEVGTTLLNVLGRVADAEGLSKAANEVLLKISDAMDGLGIG